MNRGRLLPPILVLVAAAGWSLALWLGLRASSRDLEMETWIRLAADSMAEANFHRSITAQFKADADGVYVLPAPGATNRTVVRFQWRSGRSSDDAFVRQYNQAMTRLTRLAGSGVKQ
jgi:hypothetical protein